MQAKLPLTKEENALDRAKRMTEEERIDFIREHGTEAMKRGLDSIFNGNKYKPARKEMWESRLKRGELMVRRIIERREDT